MSHKTFCRPCLGSFIPPRTTTEHLQVRRADLEPACLHVLKIARHWLDNTECCYNVEIQSRYYLQTIMHFSVEEIHKRMKNLQAQYGRIMKTPPSGSGVKARTPRQEWLVKRLGFLKVHIKGRDTISSYQVH